MTSGNTHLTTLGERIKFEIKERKLNSSAIARDMGLAPQSINQIDTRKTFTYEFLKKLKKATNGIIDFTEEASEIESTHNFLLEDSKETYNKKGNVDITFNISVKTDKGSINKLGALMESFSTAAKNLGFELNY